MRGTSATETVAVELCTGLNPSARAPLAPAAMEAIAAAFTVRGPGPEGFFGTPGTAVAFALPGALALVLALGSSGGPAAAAGAAAGVFAAAFVVCADEAAGLSSLFSAVPGPASAALAGGGPSGLAFASSVGGTAGVCALASGALFGGGPAGGG